MVTRSSGLVSRRDGKVKLGCIFGLLLLGAGLYYGLPIGRTYLSYYRMLDEMRTQARLAPGFDTNDPIRRRLVEKAQDLRLPPEASRFTIRRTTTRPREIIITTTWPDTLEFRPFYRYPITFKPEAREPL